MIIRRNYRACLDKAGLEKDMEAAIKSAIARDKERVSEAVTEHRCLTVAMYQHENMLFLYMEALEKDLEPAALFPELSKLLLPWPQKDGLKYWARMYEIFYHDIPTDEAYWTRKGHKTRRGRIAYLLEDKLFSYTYYHKALVDEGLLEGDRYQFIALHENILFSYFEEPKEFTHIKKESTEESKVIKDWLAADPESHFDHTLSGKDNFLLLPEVFSMGVEDSDETV